MIIPGEPPSPAGPLRVLALDVETATATVAASARSVWPACARMASTGADAFNVIDDDGPASVQSRSVAVSGMLNRTGTRVARKMLD